MKELSFTYTANVKRQMSDSSWQFLKIENEQLKRFKTIPMHNEIAWNY